MRSSIFKIVIAAVLTFNGFLLADHPRSLQSQQRSLQNKSNRLNMPAQNETRQQRVTRQLKSNEVRQDLARVENRIATSRPSASEQSALQGRNRSTTRILANQFVTESSPRDFTRGTAPRDFRHKDYRVEKDYSPHQVTVPHYRSYEYDSSRSNVYSPRIHKGSSHQSI